MVSMSQISAIMKVAPATSTAMIKRLSKMGYLHYVPHKGCSLNSRGKALGVSLQRRHKLIEEFLYKILNYDWAEVHKEAEILEHAVSDNFIERIDALLDYPRYDPHGDPIPNEHGAVETLNDICLARYYKKGTIRIERVVNASERLLRYMKKERIVPGAMFSFTCNEDVAQMIHMQHCKTNSLVILPASIAQHVFVSNAEDASDAQLEE